MSRQKKIVILVVSILAIIALIVGGLFVYKNISDPMANKRQKVVTSEVYKEISSAVTVDNNQPGSVVIAPASQKWWDSLRLFSPLISLDNIDYGSIEQNALYVSFTNSLGGEYQSDLTIGVPTTIITYSDKDSAENASAKLKEDSYAVEVSGNSVLILPPGTYSDLDYTISTVENKFTGSDPLELNGEAFWQINSLDLEKIFFKHLNDHDKNVYATILTKLTGSDNISWTGTSKDGESWDGYFKGFNPAKTSSIEDTLNYISQQRAYLLTDGTYSHGEIPDPKLSKDSSYEEQSMIATCCLVISDGETISLPTALIPDDSPFYKKLDKKDGILQFTIVPDIIFSALSKQETFALSRINAAVITIQNANGKANIRITDKLTYDNTEVYDDSNTTQLTDEEMLELDVKNENENPN